MKSAVGINVVAAVTAAAPIGAPPGTYLKALTYRQPATLLPDTDLLEYFCTGNEKDVRHFR